MQDAYRTVAHPGVHETEVNRSRFLCALAPAATEKEAQDFVAAVRKEHADATHNCYAYVIGADAAIQKASDDGEPGGTAGVPMLQMLLRRDMRYVVAVVTRYYGGVKLGAGGLIRAYGGAVGEALDAVGTLTRRRFRLATVTVDHQRAGKVQNDLRSTGREVRDVRYGEAVTIEIGLPDADVDAFRGGSPTPPRGRPGSSWAGRPTATRESGGQGLRRQTLLADLAIYRSADPTGRWSRPCRPRADPLHRARTGGPAGPARLLPRRFQRSLHHESHTCSRDGRRSGASFHMGGPKSLNLFPGRCVKAVLPSVCPGRRVGLNAASGHKERGGGRLRE